MFVSGIVTGLHLNVTLTDTPKNSQQQNADRRGFIDVLRPRRHARFVLCRMHTSVDERESTRMSAAEA